MPEPVRPTPEELLARIEAEERLVDEGRLKVFLGYASGVGKSFRMFDEGRRRKMRGQDVIVGATQPDNSPAVIELLAGFELVDLVGGALDLTAILERRPQMCLVDGLAYGNPPGSKNAQRWQDVSELLAEGISVTTSVNLQYVKERQPQVETIRGKVVLESVPEAFLRQAHEIEVVDAPAESGVERVSELREIALLLAAEVVDHQRQLALRRQGRLPVYGTHERILICVTPRSNATLMIHRGRRQADRFHGDLHVVYVEQDGISEADRRTMEQNLEAARAARAVTVVLRGGDAVAAILAYARQNGITQLFVGHSRQEGWLRQWIPNPVERLILEADGMDVRIFPNEAPHA